jgi:hypothetical protein
VPTDQLHRRAGGVDVTASVVAHTWGTETVFAAISGLPAGSVHEVVLVGR